MFLVTRSGHLGEIGLRCHELDAQERAFARKRHYEVEDCAYMEDAEADLRCEKFLSE